MEEQTIQNTVENKQKNDGFKQISGAIIVAALIIGGAILLKDNSSKTSANNTPPSANPAKVTGDDRILGDPNAKVTVIMYEDFQCPFCGAVSGLEPNSPVIQALKQRDPNWSPSIPVLRSDYIEKGTVRFVYRDFTFLGPESIRAAEAARCAGDQGKFWDYHDYLYGHQNGENKGAFSDPNLKSFAKTLGLDTTAFNTCLDQSKYAKAVTDSKAEGVSAGVNSTPKGFILRSGKVVGTIDGAEPWSSVKPKIDSALK